MSIMDSRPSTAKVTTLYEGPGLPGHNSPCFSKRSIQKQKPLSLWKTASVQYGSLNPLKGRTFHVVFRLIDGKATYRNQTKPSRRYRNQLLLAHEWQRALENGDYSSPAALARKLGFSRARVTQVLRLLSLTPEVQQQLMALGDPL